MTGWEKVTGTMTGGKRFFWYHREKQLWVVWSRKAEAWVVERRSGAIEEAGQHKTKDAAIKAAEKLKGNQ